MQGYFVNNLTTEIFLAIKLQLALKPTGVFYLVAEFEI